MSLITLKLIIDREPQVRHAAAEALRAFETAEAARALIVALTDPSAAVRVAAAASLAETKDVEATGDLIPIVTHAKAFVADFEDRTGRRPSFTEVKDATGLSKSTVNVCLSRLNAA